MISGHRSLWIPAIAGVASFLVIPKTGCLTHHRSTNTTLTFLSSRPCEMFSASMNPHTRCCTGPASPQCGRSTNVFRPCSLHRHTQNELDFKYVTYEKIYTLRLESQKLQKSQELLTYLTACYMVHILLVYIYF